MDKVSTSHIRATNQQTKGAAAGVRGIGLAKAVTHVGVSVLVAIDVEERQDVNVHLVEQAGHLSIAAKGRQSLRADGGNGVINVPRPATPVRCSSSPL